MGIDPGAKRLGWSVVSTQKDGTYKYWDSGIHECDRKDGELYQAYRLRAMQSSIRAFKGHLPWFAPDEIVIETLPVKGFNDMGQAYLALSVVSAITGYAMSEGYKVSQIGATTVKKCIGGSNKATKVRIRNTVWQIFPELQKKAPEWKKVYDESDAIAIGLTYLGYQRPK